MLNMDVVALITIGVVGAGAITVFAMTFSHRWLRHSANAFAKSVSLALPSNTAAVTRRIARRSRGASIGALLAVGLVLATGLNAGPDDSATLSEQLLLLFGGGLAGVAVGVAVATATMREAVTGPVRYARVGAVSLRDYIAPIESDGARVVVVLAAMSTVGMVIADATGAVDVALWPPAGNTAVFAVLAVLSLVFFEAMSRRLVRAPQPAGSPEDLTWNDALRAWHIRDFVTAPLALGVYTIMIVAVDFASAMDASTTVPLPAIMVAHAAVPLLMLAILAMAVIAFATKPQRHFLRRLWSEVAAGSTR
jgi:hypothetical protein